MNCFSVGIRICGDKSEFMVDDIFGVSSNVVHALKDNEQQRFSDFFTQLKDSAYKDFLKDLELELLKRKKFNHIVSETKPYSGSVKSELVTNKGTIGYRIELPYHQFTEYHLRGFDLFAHRSGSVQIRVTDLINGEIVYVKDHDLNRGKNTLSIDKRFYSKDSTHYFVGINIGTAVLETVSCDGQVYKGSSCCDYLVCDCENEHGTIEPCEYMSCETAIKPHCKVFCINAAIRCNLEDILCEYKEFFNEAYKYKVALNILNHKITSNERGWYIDSNIGDLREFTIPELKESYYRLMHLGITNISDLLNDSICFSSDGISGLIPQAGSYA
jgi:hypothetical protein